MSNNAVIWHDRIAKRFSSRYAEGKLFRDRYRVWSRWLTKYSHDECGKKRSYALDLGCGAGNLSLVLARCCETLYCVDGSREMAALCRDTLSAEGFVNAVIEVNDIDEFCIHSTRLFDVISCSSVLEYVENIAKTLGGIKSRLNENGILLFSIPNADSVYRRIERNFYRLTGRPAYYRYVRNVLSLSEMQILLSQLGLELIEVEYLTEAPLIGPLLAYMGDRRSKSLILLACKPLSVALKNSF